MPNLALPSTFEGMSQRATPRPSSEESVRSFGLAGMGSSRCCTCHLSERHRALPLRVPDRAVCGRQLGQRHLQVRGGGLEQHFPSGCTHFAHDVVERGDALAVAREHPLIDRIPISGIVRRELEPTCSKGKYSSSARTAASVVVDPCPISDCEATRVMELSGEILTHAVTGRRL